ncbi:hypothetical protein [Thiocapsa roseopersicina]|uniref:Uncharacterized protein n=1 Tax=Thiocapsa roseopersicina TaxID=1058 RepID=A0A1H3DPY2_THIRO|nr:hypothetical protein [Thiocapsa roseopersicina]SDX68466.1 hypothetical protein SAMN05421783_1557 [Thiocapsa roseopersicina]
MSFNELLGELRQIDQIRQFHGNLDRWRENLQTLADAKARAMRLGKALPVRFERPAFRSAADAPGFDQVLDLIGDYRKSLAPDEKVGVFINRVRHQAVAKALQKADAPIVAKPKPSRAKAVKTAIKSPSIAGSYAPAAYRKPKPKRQTTAFDVVAKATQARAKLVEQITLGRMTAAEINARDLRLRNIIARANRAQSASA